MHFPETPLHQFGKRPTPATAVAVPVVAAPVDDFAFDDPVKEEQFQQAWHVLRTTEDPRAKPSWWLFGIIVGIFGLLMWQGGQFDVEQVGLLAAVIVLHELGHFVPMKLFGYTDSKLFFFPLFGMGVRGRRHAAPAWQQAMTILLGPLPGLFLALALYLSFRDEGPTWVIKLVVLLTLLNGVNLLPLGFTDAGRFLNLVVYSRNAYIETLMQLVSAGLFAWIAYWHQHYVLGALTLVMILSAPTVFRIGLMTARLRREGLQMPDTVAALEPIHGRMLFAATYDVLGRSNAGTLAGVMRQLHDRVLVPAPGVLATVGFLLLYLGGWAMVVGTAGLIVEDYQRLTEKVVFPESQPEYRWKKEAEQHRRRARRLEGVARLEAQAQAAELQRKFNAWHEEQVRKITTFHDAIVLGPAVGPVGNPDVDEEEER